MATLLLVHAHPDDEAISTGGVMLKARAEGHRVVLVTATRGEVGEIYNMDEASSRPRLGEIREKELEDAARILGVNRGEFLGYRDSGMAGTPITSRPTMSPTRRWTRCSVPRRAGRRRSSTTPPSRAR